MKSSPVRVSAILFSNIEKPRKTGDATGNVYFTGYTCSPNNISTPGAYQEVYNGIDDETGDVMVGAFTTDGALLWCSYHSGPSQDRAHDIVLLENGDFYVEGTCESTTQFATAGIHQSTYGGGPQDAFLFSSLGHPNLQIK